MRRTLSGILSVLLWGLSVGVEAGEAPAGRVFHELSLEDLLKIKLTLASQTPQTLRESPGIVTVVTREEILASGARDLVDVLMRVPGFSFGMDVRGIVSVGFRGNWGQEGKVLLLVDGHDYNELFYGNLVFSHHLPVEAIQSIEIIRGPGSAAYGGNAELAVINVITLDSGDMSGGRVAARFGRMKDADGHRSVTASYAWESAGGVRVSASGFLGEANLSDRHYADVFGASYPMAESNVFKPRLANLGLEYKGLRLRLLADRYRTRSRDAFVDILPAATVNNFSSTFAELSYDWELNEKTRLTPRFSYKRQTPWQDRDLASPMFYDVTAERFAGRVQVSSQVARQLSLAGGVEARYERGRANQRSPIATFAQDFEGYTTAIAFGEASFSSPLGNVLAGARFEGHSQFGNVTVPRLSMTKVIGRYHFKLLHGRAFRTPPLMALANRPDIRPERTRVYEAEVGVRLGSEVFLTANVFDTKSTDTVTWFWIDDEARESFRNGDYTGSRGVEVEGRLDADWGGASFSYSLYRSRNDIAERAVPQARGQVLGLPAHKAALAVRWRLADRWTLAPSAVFSTRRYATTAVDEDFDVVVTPIPGHLLLDAFLTRRDLFRAGLDVSVGAHNLLDRPFTFPQPYNSWHAPLPGASRELVLRVSYRFGS